MAVTLTHPAFHEAFEAQSARDAGAIALALDAEAWTYGTLNARANRLARALIARGVGPGSLVALHLSGLFAMPLAILAVHKAGAAYVAVEPALPAARRAAMLAVAGRPLLLTDEAPAPEVMEQASAVWDWDALQHEAAAQADDNPGLAVAAEAVACLFFTSGSTGTPKAVVVPHRSIAGHIGTVPAIARIEATDRYLFTASYSFVLSIRLMLQLAAGGCVVLVPPAEKGDPLALLSRVKAMGVTCMSLVPTFWRACIQALEALGPAARADLLDNRLRLIQVVGEPLRPDLPLRWSRDWGHPARVVNFYGQTEIFSVACFEVPLGWNDGPTVPIGLPSTGVEIHLLDEAMRPVPAGTPGEVYAAGGWTAASYMNDPGATAEKFPPNPFGEGRLCRTGDMGRLEPDGTLVLMGRGDRMLKIRGQRVEPGEVEAHLLTHPQVEAAAVVGQADDAGGVRLVAFVVAKPGAAPDARAMRRFVAQALPSAMVPSAISWLSALPVNANGKVDLAGLRARPVAQDPLPQGDVPSCSADVETLQRIWGQVLGLAAVPVDADFFDLGGESLQAVRMINLAEQAFERRGLLRAFVATPTIAGLAAVLAEADAQVIAGAPPLLVKLSAGQGGAPLILLPPIWGSPSTYLGLLHRLGSGCPVYGAHLVGLRGELGDEATFEAIAAVYGSEIRKAFPGVPVRLGGYSMGGLLAFEVARQLERAGEHVGQVFLLDTYTTRRRSGRSSWRQRVIGVTQLIEVATGLRAFALLGTMLEFCRARARAGGSPGQPTAGPKPVFDAPVTPASGALPPLTFGDMIDLLHYDRATWGLVARWRAIAQAFRLAKRPPASRRREWLETLRVDTPMGDQGDIRRASLLLKLARTAYERSGHLTAPMTLFKAAQAPTGGIFGWEAFGAVTCVSVPGSHSSLMKPPHVEVLARRMTEALAETSAQG